MRTSNPALSDNSFRNIEYARNEDTMTMNGCVTKTAMLLLMALLSAAWTWIHFYKSGAEASSVSTFMLIGGIGGFILAMVTVFKPAWSAITAPLYAVLEGFFLGGISAIMELSYPGIVIQATILTFGTLFAMLAAYRSGFIRVTENFKLGIVAATGGIALAYIATMILGFFNVEVPLIHGNGLVGIGFSLFVVVIAALNFVLDFDFIEQAVKRGAPKHMEWYAGFALMVTLVWLYVEFLRLLSKLRSRD